MHVTRDMLDVRPIEEGLNDVIGPLKESPARVFADDKPTIDMRWKCLTDSTEYSFNAKVYLLWSSLKVSYPDLTSGIADVYALIHGFTISRTRNQV
jgi:hypothetical protein